MSETTKNYTNEENSYLIPVQWTSYSTIRVEADNLEDALKIAREKLADIPITPNECEYVDDSYTLLADSDEDLIQAQNYRDVSSVVIRRDGNIER